MIEEYKTHEEYLCEEPKCPDLLEFMDLLGINEQLDLACERGYN